jgi:hypothetical protein
LVAACPHTAGPGVSRGGSSRARLPGCRPTAGPAPPPPPAAGAAALAGDAARGGRGAAGAGGKGHCLVLLGGLGVAGEGGEGRRVSSGVLGGLGVRRLRCAAAKPTGERGMVITLLARGALYCVRWGLRGAWSAGGALKP